MTYDFTVIIPMANESEDFNPFILSYLLKMFWISLNVKLFISSLIRQQKTVSNLTIN